MIFSRPWFVVIGLLTLVWSGVGVVMRMTDHAVSSPAQVLTLMNAPEWQNAKAGDRRERLLQVTAKLNRLTFDQRTELREDAGAEVDAFVEALSDDEKQLYVDQTITPRFEAIAKGFQAMPEEEREKFAARLRRDFKARPPPGMPEELEFADDKIFREAMEKDMEASFRKSSIETKLKMAPMLEEIQSRLQGFGRR